MKRKVDCERRERKGKKKEEDAVCIFLSLPWAMDSPLLLRDARRRRLSSVCCVVVVVVGDDEGRCVDGLSLVSGGCWEDEDER